jgi:hypothetical protein
MVASPPPRPGEQVPGTTLLCLSVAAARSNLVVVTASVKGYEEPMTILIDSGASYNFATKASVARNSMLYAKALEDSKSNSKVSVRLATGSIVSTRKVLLPLTVKFDDFNSVEPFIVLDMDDRYALILGMPWLVKHEPWIDWRSRTIGASHKPLADRALAGHVPSSSRDGFVHEHRVPRGERHFASSAEEADVPNNHGGRARAPTTLGVRAGSAVAAEEEVAVGVRSTTQGGRAEAPTTQGVRVGSAVAAEEEVAVGVRSTTQGGRAEAPTTQGVRVGSAVAAEEEVAVGVRSATMVVDAITGDRTAIDVAPVPTLSELLELEELSYVEFLESLKAGELEDLVLLRRDQESLDLNSSSVMDPDVLEEERVSKRQRRYGAAILKDPSDPYYSLLKEFSDVVSEDPPSVLPPDRGVRHEIYLVPGTKYCTTR